MQGNQKSTKINNSSPRGVIPDTRKLSRNNSTWRTIRFVKFVRFVNTIIIIALTVLSVNALNSIIYTDSAYAEGSALNVKVTVPETPVLEISLLDPSSGNTMTDAEMTVLPSMAYAGFNEVGVNVRVGTSNTGGYTLAMNVANNSLTASSGATIPSLAVDSTNHPNGYTCTYQSRETCDFTLNSWGYRIASTTSEFPTTTNYLPVPNHQTLDNYTSATNGKITSLYFGSRVNTSKPAGTYTTTINFVAVANTSDERPYMQGITNSAIAAEIPEVGATAYLYDNRDENAYLVGRLADGNYWMLQNLALDPAGIINQLSINNTNLDPDTPFTLPNSISNNFNSYTEPQLNTASKNTTQPLAMEQDGTSTVGVYYNYCAATAGTYCYSYTDENNYEAHDGVNAEYDICPKGWRLPTGGAVNTTIGTGEYENLRSQYDSDADFASALKTPLAGEFGNASAHSQGVYGRFWSSVYYNATDMYLLRVYNAGVVPQSSYNRNTGLSVRCIFDSSSPSAHGVNTMQDVASLSSSDKATLLADMKTGTSYLLKDSRDNHYYHVAKLADGKVWMLDNLALDPTDSSTTLNSSNTNATTEQLAAYLNPTTGVKNVSSGFTSYTSPMINTASKDTTQPLAMGQSGEGKVGVYYNYCAATAGTYCESDTQTGTNNAEYDICPKGWRLPTGGAVNTTTGTGEFQNLRNQYNNNADFVSALKTPISGYFRYSSASNLGVDGNFWSSTYYDASRMHYLVTYTDSINPQDRYYRNGGLTLRCILD